MISNRPTSHYEVKADETEEQLVERAQLSLSTCNWTVGDCASQWTERHARGRTDADFGATIGLSGDQVRQRRLVWEKFSGVRAEYPSLKWSHFYAAINWEDAATCLDWANTLGATVAEMKAWRRSQHGEDLSEPAEEEAQQPVAREGENRESGRATERVNRNAARPARGGGSEAKSTRDKAAAESPAVPAGKKRSPAPDANRQEPLDSSPQAPSTRLLSESKVIVKLRELLRRAQNSLDQEALSHVGDECRSWAAKLDPTPVALHDPSETDELTAEQEFIEAWNKRREWIGSDSPGGLILIDSKTLKGVSKRQFLENVRGSPTWMQRAMQALEKFPLPFYASKNQQMSVRKFTEDCCVEQIIAGTYDQPKGRSSAVARESANASAFDIFDRAASGNKSEG